MRTFAIIIIYLIFPFDNFSQDSILIKNMKYGSIPEDSLNGTYHNASYDTSLFGNYLNGRWLSGIFLDLYKDSSFEKNFFCDICPEYKRTGYYFTSSDTIFLVDTLVSIEKDTFRGRDEYSLWYHPSDKKLRTDTLFIWHINNHILLDFKKQNDIDSYRIKYILTFFDEWVKMDFLPYRKLE